MNGYDLAQEAKNLERKIRDFYFAQSSDRWQSAARLVREAAVQLEYTEREERIRLGKCADCFHAEGSHVNDSDVTVPTTYECQVKHCTCPEYVKQVKT